MTYEMVGLADQNGRTYKSAYGEYSKEKGFDLNYKALSIGEEELLDAMFHENLWKLKVEPKKMTKKEIEEALGYEVEIIEKKARYADPNGTVSVNNDYSIDYWF